MPCEPPRLGRREARDLLANKTVAFVGDSVSRMMFCETAAWLFGVKGWWWQNRWVPAGSPCDEPSAAAAPPSRARRSCGFGNACSTARGTPPTTRAPPRSLRNSIRTRVIEGWRLDDEAPHASPSSPATPPVSTEQASHLLAGAGDDPADHRRELRSGGVGQPRGGGGARYPREEGVRHASSAAGQQRLTIRQTALQQIARIPSAGRRGISSPEVSTSRSAPRPRALLLWRDDATAGDAAARRDAGGEEQFDVDRHRAVGGARRRVVCAGGPLVHRPPVARGRLMMVNYTESRDAMLVTRGRMMRASLAGRLRAERI